MRYLQVIWLILAGTTIYPSVPPSSDSDPQHLLRKDEQTALIAKDLQHFIPGYLEEQGIPGCAIALIQNHQVAWTEGFGVTNTIRKTPVNRETLFEVASNSKIVSSYIALRLVAPGKLSLDTPLNGYLAEPWFPGSVYGDSITLRHVLSHSSGLGHNERGRELLFKPGSGYYYSNQGFSFLQEVIEKVTHGSLEQVALEQVFRPLEMESTSYVNRKELRRNMANGHIDGGYLMKISALLWLVPVLLVVLPGIVLLRILRKRWIPKKREAGMGIILVISTWLLALFLLFGLVGWLKYGWLLLFFNTGLAASVLVLIVLGRMAVDRSKVIPSRKKRWVKGIWVMAVAGLLCLGAASMERIPVPKWSRIRPMAEASLRTNVHDMASFLLELVEPAYLSEDLASQLRESQIILHQDISWGLGMGILHTSQGDALWQWGQNADFQSLTIIYPEYGFGAVVFTNSDWNQPDVAIEIANRALGGDFESLKRAAHLEFNMHLQDD